MLLVYKYSINFITGLFLFTLITPVFGQTKVFDKVIAADGTGDYPSIAYAISMYSNSRKVFFIKNGIYREKILISSQKTNIRLIGESRDGVIITYDDYAGKSASSTSTAESYTFRVEGDGFYAENITFQNTATQAQAVAVYTRADTVAFKNCRFLGYQDTHFADKGRQYFLNCETRGDVDFIFGDGAVFYDQSVIVSRSRKAGYITAPADAKVTSPKTGGGTNYHGILIHNCDVIAETGLADNSCYLGRPWNTYAASAFINCRIGNHIKPEGWSVWTTDPTGDGYNNHLTAFFAEYKSMKPDGGLVDISNRVSWSKQLGDTDTALYSIPDYFLGWDPTIKTTALSSPQNLKIINDSLVWDEISSCRGYVILCNDSVIGFSKSSSFYIGQQASGIFTVKSVNPFGALSSASQQLLPTGTNNNPEISPDIIVYVNQGMLLLPENCNAEIFNITGTKIRSSVNQCAISLNDLKEGVYIVKILPDQIGTCMVRKILYTKN
ncbi:MAG: hypothetical protein JXB00_00420 [Bacteroidales bacterium]|nr:hypothetical protein [Bacteroidales bacterium]